MVRMTIFILLTCLLGSCSSSRINRKIQDPSWDALADESYLRWDESRLNQLKDNKREVVKCYQGNFSTALEAYKAQFSSKERSQSYWLDIGNCYFIEESWTKAEFFYHLTIQETKNPVLKSIALNNLGLIHFKYGQWEKGRDFLKESLSLSPKAKVPRFNLSQLFIQFGLYENAIEILTDDLLKGHKDIDFYFSLANAYLFKGDLKKASEFFSLIPKEHFSREDIASTYSLYLVRVGQLSEAKAVMKDRNRSDVPELTVIAQKIEKIILQKLKEE